MTRLIPDFHTLTREELDPWLDEYARAMADYRTDELPPRLLSLVQNDPDLTYEVSQRFLQIEQSEQSDSPTLPPNGKAVSIRSTSSSNYQQWLLAASVTLLVIVGASLFYVWGQWSQTRAEIALLHAKQDSLILLTEQLQNETDSLRFLAEQVKNTPETKPSSEIPVKNPDSEWMAERMELNPNAFAPNPTYESEIRDAIAMRSGGDNNVQRTFRLITSFPANDAKILNGGMIGWRILKNNQPYDQEVQLKFYGKAGIKTVTASGGRFNLTPDTGLNEGLYYWSVIAEDEKVHTGKFYYFKK
jgi:hypothetical protein